MKKNGFTLAELLGVIVILVAIALVAFPPIINQIKKSRGDIDNSLNTLILTASEQYLEEHNYLKEGTYCIKLNLLVTNGKLVDPVTDSKGGVIDLNSVFFIDYDQDNYTYALYGPEENISNRCDYLLPSA